MKPKSSSPQNRSAESPLAAAPAASSVWTSGAENAAFLRGAAGGLSLELPERIAVFLAIVAAHDRVTPEQAIARAVCARIEEIGLSRALDLLAEEENAPNRADDHGKQTGKSCHG